MNRPSCSTLIIAALLLGTWFSCAGAVPQTSAPPPGAASTRDTTADSLKTLVNDAYKAFSLRQYQTALDKFSAAAEGFKARKDTRNLLDAQLGLAQSLWQLSRAEEGLALVREIRTQADAIGDSLARARSLFVEARMAPPELRTAPDQIKSLQESIRIFHALRETDREHQAVYFLAVSLYLSNRKIEALPYLEQALLLHPLPADSSSHARLLYLLGGCQGLSGDITSQETSWLKSFAIAEAIRDTATLAAAAEDLADLYYGKNDYRQSIPYHETASRTSDDPQVKYVALMRLATAYHETGRKEEALSVLQGAIEFAQHNLKQRVILTQAIHATFLSLGSRYDQSLQEYSRLLSGAGDDSMKVEIVRQIDIAASHGRKQGDLDAAIRLERLVLQNDTSATLSRLRRLTRVGDDLRRKKEFTESKQLFLAAVPLSRALGNRWEEKRALEGLGKIALVQESRREAVDFLRQAADIKVTLTTVTARISEFIKDKDGREIALLQKGTEEGLLTGEGAKVVGIRTQARPNRGGIPLGVAEIIDLDGSRLAARITTHGASDSTAIVGDAIEVPAVVPVNPRPSLLYRVMKGGITFLNKNDKPFIEFHDLLASDSSRVVEALYAAMAADLQSIRDMRAWQDTLKRAIQTGRYRGHTPLEILSRLSGADVAAYFSYLLDHPYSVCGSYRLDGWFLSWMLAGGPPGTEEIIERGLALKSADEQRGYLAGVVTEFAAGNVQQSWVNHVEACLGQNRLEDADRAARLLGLASTLIPGAQVRESAELAYHFGLARVLDAKGMKQESIREYEAIEKGWQTSDPNNYAAAVSNIGSLYAGMGKPKEALQYREKAVRATEEFLRQNPGSVGRISLLRRQMGVAAALYNLSMYDEAEQAYRKAMETVKGEPGDEALTQTARIYDQLGYISSKRGEYRKSIELYVKALAIRSRLEDQSAEALSASNIGSGYWNLGEYRAALGYYDRALFLRQTINDSSLIGETLLDLGGLYWNLGAYDTAASNYSEAKGIYSRLADSLNESKADQKTGALFRATGRFADAVASLQHALELRRRLGNLSLTVDTYCELGDTYFEQKNYQECEQSYREALRLQSQLGDRSTEARLLEGLSAVHFQLHDIDRSREEALQALKVWQDVGDAVGIIGALERVGGSHEFTGNWKEATACYQQARDSAVKTQSRSLEAVSLVRLGGVLWRQGNSREALPLYRKALAIYDSLGNKSDQAGAHISLGGLYYGLAEYDSSSAQLNAGLQLARDTRDRTQEARALDNLSWIVAIRGDPDSAMRIQEQILGIYQDTKNEFGQASTIATFGRIQREKGRLNEALEKQLDVLERFRRLRSVQNVVSAHLDAADVYAAMRDYPNAIKHVNNALGIERDIRMPWAYRTAMAQLGDIEYDLASYDAALGHYAEAESVATVMGDRLNVGALQTRRAKVYRAKGEYAKASSLLGSAMASRRQLGPDIDTYDIQQELGIVAYRNREYEKAAAYLDSAIQQTERQGMPANLWEELHYRGLVERERGNAQGAIQYCTKAVDVVERVRGGLGSEVAQTLYQSDKNDLYNDLIDLLLSVPDCGDCKTKALQYLERSKSAELASLFSNVFPAPRSEAEKAVVHQAQTFQTREVAMRRQLEEERRRNPAARNQESIDRILAQLGLLQQEFDRYVKSLPEDQRRLVEIAPGEFRQIQNSLNPGEVFIQPMVLKDRIVVFAVRWGTNVPLVVRETRVSEAEVNETLHTLREALSQPGQRFGQTRTKRVSPADPGTASEDPLQFCQKLYDWIIKPVLPEITDATALVISASGRLRYIPFAVLHDGTQYLVERYTLSMLTRAGSLAIGQTTRLNITNPSLLALSNPDTARAPLPAADLEVDSLKSMFTGSGTEGNRIRLLKHDQATKRNLQSSLFEYEILHLATHGYLNDEAPGQSYILLAGSDSKLTFDEISKLEAGQLHLVTLSACQTALGDRAQGQEIAGLAYGFEKAGVATVVASLWSVNDESTMELMAGFYANLKAGKSRGAAMQEAQKAMLGSKKFSHPYFWSPFLVIGSWR